MRRASLHPTAILFVGALWACGSDLPAPDVGPLDASGPVRLDAGQLDQGPAQDMGPADMSEQPDMGMGVDMGMDMGVQDLGPQDMGTPTMCPGGSGAPTQAQLSDGTYTANIQVTDESDCLRSYSLGTDAPLRDHPGGNPRIIVERADTTRVRTSNPMFDGLYALSIEETRENSVDAIRDGAFNNGQPLDCPPGGCFETGRLWNYVWTRDTAYAVDLALAAIDPIRAKNSLEFKLSARRDGSDLQIVQDTGSGGSYPISSDRAVWSLGAERLLHYLDGPERDAFISRAFEAARNTIEHDRAVVYDPVDGLYRGEQSFLDWREQSYAPWTATDTVHLGMSKSLSTNVGHLRLLELASNLAERTGDATAMMTYAAWAQALRQAIHQRLFLEAEGLYSTFVPTFLDPAPVRRYDLLGSSLAVLSGLGDATQRAGVVSTYPHTPMGPPVMWPQQKDVPIYHNRALWPFVTAYWLRAAKQVQNAAVVDHNMRSMMRGAALNLSNMENLEMLSGLAFVEDGIYSGPVVNSQRQLWSVAGYTSMVHDVIFGVETTMDSVRFSPFITRGTRSSLFASQDTITLVGLRYRGRRLTVTLRQPGTGDPEALVAGSVTIDGAPAPDPITPNDLRDGSMIEVELVDASPSGGTLNLVNATDGISLFSPKPPQITAVNLNNGQLELLMNISDELASDVLLNVFRDGQLIAQGLSGDTTSYIDPGSSASSPSHCYVLESYYPASGNASQHSQPNCYWGPGFDRIQDYLAQDFVAVAREPGEQPRPDALRRLGRSRALLDRGQLHSEHDRHAPDPGGGRQRRGRLHHRDHLRGQAG